MLDALCPRFSNFWYFASPGAFPSLKYHPGSPLGGFSLYHCYPTSETLWAPPTTILTGSWTAGDSTSRLHLYTGFLRPLLVLNAPVEVSQGVDSEVEMRAQALIFMLCLQSYIYVLYIYNIELFHALPPELIYMTLTNLGRFVKVIYISYCQIFLHVAQIH